MGIYRRLRTGIYRRLWAWIYRRSACAKPMVFNNKKMNPIGADGRTLTCKSCGSFRHLVAACPDSWENMAKVNVADEHAVLFTGNKRDAIAELGVEARNCAVLDSACSSTVCGKNWLDAYVNSLDHKDRKMIKHVEWLKKYSNLAVEHN